MILLPGQRASVLEGTGGNRQHATINFGIPAVVGVFEAMTHLHDGQRIRVDGDSGTVVVLE